MKIISLPVVSAFVRKIERPLLPQPILSKLGMLWIVILLMMTDLAFAITDCTYPTPQSEVPQAECQALVDLYNSTDGLNWSDTTFPNNWNVTNTPCSWIGVTCSVGTPKHVTAIDRNNQSLVGPLPPSLNQLTSLQNLYLYGNQLNGTIPDLSALTSLQNLYLYGNQLTGTIPDLSALINLQYLYLSDNLLTGSIPNLSTFTNLQYLNLGNNELTGTIPDLSSLSNLQYLFLDRNQLTGAIPSLSALTNLLRLDLQFNQLSGTIPDLSSLTSLQYLLNLSNNQLTGPIPDLSALTNLQGLYLNNNQLTGSIPPNLNTLTSLQYLNLSNNLLTGIIPDLNITALTVPNLDLSYNQLTGETGTSATDRDPDWTLTQTFPEIAVMGNAINIVNGSATPNVADNTDFGYVAVGSSVGKTYTIQNAGSGTLILSSVTLSGTSCSEFMVTTQPPTSVVAAGTVSFTVQYTPTATGTDDCIVNIANNDVDENSYTFAIRGNGMPLCTVQTEIPESECNALIDLYNSTGGPSWTDAATNNWKVTTTPCSWAGVSCNAGTVVSLNRYSRGLTGTLPSSLSQLTNLVTLQMSINQLTGNIPNLPTTLQFIYLYRNQLTGTIPTIPPNTENLWLFHNQLTGTIPALPSNLKILHLNSNQLTGGIPPLPPSLTHLTLSDNRLSGNIPSTLPAGLIKLYLFDNQLSGIIPDLSGATALVNVNLGYNAFTGETAGSATAKDPSWELTQTRPPTNVTATPLPPDSIQVNWTPIPYTADGGYYQVKYATTAGGPYVNAPTTTADKTATSYTVSGLNPNITYYLVVETFTPPHSTPIAYIQQNALTSVPSAEVSAMITLLAGYDSTPVPDSTLNLGTALVGTTITKDLTITETGNTALLVTLKRITGPNSTNFTLVNSPFPLTIPDNGTAVPVTIACTPTATGLRTAVLELTSNDPNKPKLIYPLECTGVTLTAGYAATLATTTMLDFGSLPVGTAQVQSFDFWETGEATLTVKLLDLSGDNGSTSDFKILSPSFPISLENGSNPVTVTIQCTPQAVGIHYAQLKLATNDPLNSTLTYTLACTGESVVPAYDSIPSPGRILTFSHLTDYKAHLTVTEVGQGTLDVKDYNIIGQDAANFTIMSNIPPFTLKDGDIPRTITLHCVPSVTHSISTATLQLTTNDDAHPVVEYSLVCANFHDNHQPTDILLSNPIIRQDAPKETIIGLLSTLDPEIENFPTTNGESLCASCHAPIGIPATIPTYTYTLIEDNSGLFKISGHQLLLAGSLATTTVTQYPIVIRSTDSTGLFLDKPFNIQVITEENIEPIKAVYTSIPAPYGIVQITPPSGSSLIITNDGDRDLQVNFNGITGTGDFSLDTSLFSLNLKGRSSQTMTIHCTPSAKELTVAKLILSSNDQLTPLPTYTLLCVSEKSGPKFSSFPLPDSTLNIGSSPLGYPIETVLNVIEMGTETLEVLDAAIVGLNAADFSIHEKRFSIANGANPHPLKIQCIPRNVCQQTARLILATNDPLQSAVNYELSCHGLAPEAPTMVSTATIGLSNQIIDEDVPGDTFIGRMLTDDIDPQEYHQYEITCDPHNKFVIIGDGLYTAPNAVFDFATQNSYSITIRGTNTLGISFTRSFTISINEVAKAKIYGQIATDFGDKGSHMTIDSPERITFSVIIEAPPEQLGQMADINMVARWTPIDTNKSIPIKRPTQRKRLSERLELILYQGNLLGADGIFHVDVSYQLDNGVKVSATNIATLQVRRNRPPTAITLSDHRVSGNSPPETVVGTLNTTDPDKGERFTYVVKDSEYFMAIGNELRRAYSFPPRFAKTDRIPVTIRSFDSAGNFIDQSFIIAVE